MPKHTTTDADGQELNHNGEEFLKRKAGRFKGTTKNLAPFSEKQKLAAEARKIAHLALSSLLEISQHGNNESARVAASNIILERGYGKPVQSVEHTGADGSSLEVKHVFDQMVNTMNQLASNKTIDITPTVIVPDQN